MNDRRKSVSIILTTLNSDKFLARSLESCLYQNYPVSEVIIVDGGSQDKTIEIIRSYHDKRIKLIDQENNTGKLPGAINIGMENASGYFITWTQDDCWYEINAIETMVNFLEDHTDVGLCYADYWEVDEEGAQIGYVRVNPPDMILEDDVIRSCFLFRREVYETIGPQETRYHPVHEVPWRIKLAKRFKIQPIHIPLMHYMIQPNSLTGRIGLIQLWKELSKILLAEGHITKNMANKKMSQVYLDAAYENFILNKNYWGFWKNLVISLYFSNRPLKNRGILKMMLLSLTPKRDEYGERLLCNWREKRKSIR